MNDVLDVNGAHENGATKCKTVFIMTREENLCD